MSDAISELISESSGKRFSPHALAQWRKLNGERASHESRGGEAGKRAKAMLRAKMTDQEREFTGQPACAVDNVAEANRLIKAGWVEMVPCDDVLMRIFFRAGYIPRVFDPAITDPGARKRGKNGSNH
jgi:hypothetical protein